MAKKTFEFTLGKYTNDSDGILKERKTVTVKRANFSTAQNYVKRKYLRPVGFESVNNVSKTRVWDYVEY